MIIGIIAAVLVIIILVYFLTRKKKVTSVSDVSFEDEPMTEQELQEIAEELTAECPKIVDENTQLDRATAGPGLKLTYFYTILQVAVNALTPENLNNLKETLRENYRTSEDMKPFRDSRVTLVFVYYDKNGNDLLKVECK
ncbi:MAG: hypothetical protein JW794_02375 [Candidatus Cloacimonetes bacterium]|nr:hypothetical protein [Candidatus Cloacimonadota bacterium]